MCCENSSPVAFEPPNGKCPDCDGYTVDGVSTDMCAFGGEIPDCEECGYVACHGAC